MKTFRFKYSPLVWTLLVLVLLLSLGGLAWNIFNIVEYSWADVFKIASFAIILAATAFLTAFAISVMLFGRYVIGNGKLRTRFGFISTATNVSDVVQITHFKKSDKLVVYFSDQKYSVIIIDRSEYDDFVLALRQLNPSIIYDSRIDGEDTPQ